MLFHDILIVMKDWEFAYDWYTRWSHHHYHGFTDFLNMAEFGMNIRTAIDARRFHHQWLPDKFRMSGSSLHLRPVGN